MAINTHISVLSSNSIASGQPTPADTDDCSDATTPQPANVSPQQPPWNTRTGQSGETARPFQSPPTYDPAARYRSGDTVTTNDEVYMLALAPGAPKIKGIAPGTFSSIGPSPWWYQGKVKNFHAPWSNSAIATSASAGTGNAPLEESANLHPNIRVTVNGKNVAIDLPVQFRGAGLTPERQAAMAKAIQKAWSGHFGPYDVTTTIIAPPPDAPTSQINTITVLDRPGLSSANKNEVTLYTSEPGQSSYSSTELGLVAAHEAGHLMGEVDRYALTDVDGVAGHITDPGYERNLMGNRYGTVEQRNIESIIRRTT